MTPVTVSEVERFSAFFGDSNPIHNGEDSVVVPGSLLLGLVGSELRQRLGPDQRIVSVTVRFTKPAMTGQSLHLDHETDGTGAGDQIATLRADDADVARVRWVSARVRS